MKTFWKIFFIVLGLIIFLGGCSIGGGMGATIVEFLGAMVLMVGLLPYIDKEFFTIIIDKQS